MIDRSKSDWKAAFHVLFESIQLLRDEKDIPIPSLRDFDADDHEIKELFVDLGLRRLNIPDGHIIDSFQWSSNQEFFLQLN